MLTTVGILEMATTALEKGLVDEALLHLYHARMYAARDARKLAEFEKSNINFGWDSNPDRSGK